MRAPTRTGTATTGSSAAKDDHLVLEAGPRSWDAWPASDTEFFLRDAVRTVRFVSDPSGAVTGMAIDEAFGPVEVAKRKS